MTLQIQKDANYPIYRQVADQIADMVRSGALAPGDRLPTERELSVSTAISRGTIKRAFDELGAAGIIERVQGRGTFVSETAGATRFGRQSEAMLIVEKMLDDLAEMHLSYQEMESLIGNKIQGRRLTASQVRIAVVDCNMETLGLISGELHDLPELVVSELVIDDLMKSPQRLTYGYDLILTTQNHYLQVIELAPNVADKVIKVEISPSQRVLYELARIEDGAGVGIWCMSQEYANTVYEAIAALGRENIRVQYHLDCEPGNIGAFMQDKDLMILPNDYPGDDPQEDGAVLETFREQGGKVILFDYRIDRGSLLHLEHEIAQVRRSKGGG